MPLGRSLATPPEPAAVAADRVWERGWPFRARTRFAGFRADGHRHHVERGRGRGDPRDRRRPPAPPHGRRGGPADGLGRGHRSPGRTGLRGPLTGLGAVAGRPESVGSRWQGDPRDRVPRQDWSHSRFEEVDFSQSRFHNAYFQDVVMRGAWLQRVEIDGLVDQVTINGVDVGPLIEAELDRRDPDRALTRPTDADGFRRAWEVVVRRWDAAVRRARALPEALLHERVDGEWSFIETQRHLVMATDAWVGRALLGDPAPYHPLGLPHTEMPADTPGRAARRRRPAVPRRDPRGARRADGDGGTGAGGADRRAPRAGGPSRCSSRATPSPSPSRCGAASER